MKSLTNRRCAAATVGALALGLAVAGTTTSHAAATPDPVGHWTFEPGEELVDRAGNFDDLVLEGGATISGGSLDVDDNSTWAHGGGYTGPTLREKTLVSWAALEDLDVRAGSILTIDNESGDNFDAIVFAERQPRRWMAGSTFFRRTQDVVAVDETTTDEIIQMAISYRDLGAGNVEITICRNGENIGQYTNANMTQWQAGNAEVIFGKRHTDGGLQPGAVDAKIDEARIYAEVLTCEEVGALDAPLDSDGDGVVDEEDEFPNSDTSPSVIIDGADTGVANQQLDNGATMSDRIGQCGDDAKNHGQYVSCVTRLTNDWRKAGLITKAEEKAIDTAAAKSAIGKR